MRPRLLACALVLAAAGARGEGTAGFFAPRGSFTVEVSLENFSELRLPARRSAITSLEVIGDLAVGGTTADPGLDAFLFAVSLSRRRLERVFDLGTVVAGQRGIRSAFARGRAGVLYAGTMPDRAQSGHLIRVSLTRDGIVAEDLGAPVPGDGIFALVSDGAALYGIAHPSGRFFVYRLADGHVDVYDKTAPTPEQLALYRDFELKPEDFLSRRLVVDRKGRVFGSLPVNRLFRFDPRTTAFEVLPQELPAVWDRRVLGRADAWAVAADGALFGGSGGDGLLFKLDPDTGEITNLGSPASVPRMKALAFAGDGALYGLAGAAPEYSHLFRYDPRTGGLTDYGNPQFPMVSPGIPEDLYWRGLQLGTLAVSEDGRLVVMGDEELMSQLMVFPVAAAR
jgi:sugar lactone lactonase YvrE